jgi:hypothetical protein
MTWAEIDAAWQSYLSTVRWDELQWLADNLRQPVERLEQHRVLQEMGRRYMAGVGFPPSIWPGT